MLVYTLRQTLKLLHPYMPFITEEIYQALPHAEKSIMTAHYPQYRPELDFGEEAEEMERIIGSIRAVRVRRAEMNVPVSRRANLYVVTRYPETYRNAYPFFERLASCEREDVVSIVTDAATIYIPMADMVDLSAERARLTSEIEKNGKEIARVQAKLSNAGFVEKAPAAVVEAERAKLAKYLATDEALRAAMDKLGK